MCSYLQHAVNYLIKLLPIKVWKKHTSLGLLLFMVTYYSLWILYLSKTCIDGSEVYMESDSKLLKYAPEGWGKKVENNNNCQTA